MAFLISFIFIFLVIGLAQFIKSQEVSRKFIHILVGHWVFLLPMFDSYLQASIVPFLFIIINALSHTFKIFKAMERENDTLGTVYYSISLFILVLLSHYLKQPQIAYVGILSMAYGDGFAAIIGQKYHQYRIHKNKTLSGSLTVFGFSLIITFIALTYFTSINLFNILLISMMTSLFSSLVELVSKDGLDNLSLPLTSSFVMTILSSQYSHALIFYLVFSILLVFFALKKKSLTLDGSVAALFTALILGSLGSLTLGYSMLLFFILGSGVSKLSSKISGISDPSSNRNYKQVISNSLPVVLLAIIHFITKDPKLLLLGIAVFSGATSDTFSSELGSLSNFKVFSPLTGKKVPKGLSGGVSWLGLLAGLVGSILLSSITLFKYPLSGFLFSVFLGFSNSLIDSFLGITSQRKYLDDNNQLSDIPNGPVVAGFKWMSNNKVNIFSLFITLVIGFIVLKYL